ncbi:energy transducer TonB [Sphingomonas sp.]|uniref:energy transducer TonB n=1 Tax=Sphingomonas sp. TaxID=28214 RepID=UPI00286BFEB7|nr:energy transducer TonB [Sphingomonas sp.]
MIAMMILTASGAPAASDSNDYVRTSKNGEFLSDYYPEGALKRREQGRVGFRMVVEREGWIGSCEVTESSGFSALDSETCAIIVQYVKPHQFLAANGNAVRAIQTGFISWKLPPGTMNIATPSGKVIRKPNPVICRRDNVEGSIIVKTIQCLTRHEWELQRNNMKDQIQELQGKGHTTG